MAPRQPKSKPTDDISATPSPLKPKTEKVKVEKTKHDKPKSEKTKSATASGEKTKSTKSKPTSAVAPANVADDEEDVEKATSTQDERTSMKPPPKVKPAVKKTTIGNDKDKKEKVKSVTGDEAVDVIVKYLKEQNRPYSATEISANLHGKVSKTVADKLLKEMEQNGLIMAKATNGINKGSQWVFWAKQDAADAASPEDLAAMDTAINTLRESLPALRSNLKNLTTKLQIIKSSPTTSQLAALVESIGAENKVKAEKLKGLKDGSAKTVTKEEAERVEREFKYWSGKRRARMGAYKNLEAQLLEGMTRAEIEEKVGVEDDTYV